MSDTIQIKKDTLTKGVITVLGVLLVISMFTGGFGIGSNAVTVNAAAVPNAPTPSPTAAVKVDMNTILDDDAVEGDANAPVTIVEFSDYECPYCARFYRDTYGQIKSEYIDTGKVKLIFRDFPLSFHPNAQKAAEAAECAGEQGKYYEMHNKLFGNGVTGGTTTFKAYAKQIGLDSGEFDSCLDSGEMTEEIKNDMTSGQTAGVRGTPAFFINGELVSGAQPFSVFQQKIEAALN